MIGRRKRAPVYKTGILPEFYAAIDRSGLLEEDVAEKAGYYERLYSDWRLGKPAPKQILALEEGLAVLGLRLAVVPKDAANEAVLTSSP